MRRWRPAPRAGARVALVAPASALGPERAAEAVARLSALGLQVRLGPHLEARDGPWAGTVEQRADDLAWALTAPDVDIVWLARGGEGTQAVTARLPWPAVLASPRPVVGMSDATFLHAALSRRSVPSVHAAMPGVGGGWDPFVAGAALAALWADPPWTVPLPEAWPAPHAVRGGTAEGVLVGGNLTCLAAAVGTPLMPSLKGAILLLEDVSEAAYRIDRSLTQMAQAGALDGIAGVVLGTFTACEASGGLAPESVLERALAPYGVPILAGLPLGHGPVQSAVPLGVRCRLDADAGTLTVLESAWAAAGAT